MAYFKHHIVLQYLKCNETEDWTGADETYLRIWIDGSYYQTPIHSLNDGQTWYLNQRFDFNNNIAIEVWDKDDDPDDKLGRHVLNGSSGNSARSFTGDGANYYLKFHVVNNPPQTPPEQASSIVDTIISNNYWPTIPVSILQSDIKARISNAISTNQNPTPLCGPAAILYNLIDSNLLGYVNMCKSLYETGRFIVGGKIFEPRITLRLSEVPSGMNVSDWMMMATIRDVYNSLFPIHKDMDEIAGITWPNEMVGWITRFFGLNSDFQNSYFGGEFERMIDASKAYYTRGMAFMLVKSSLIDSNSDTFYPDHWVTFLPPLSIDWGDWYAHDSGHISFGCQSWGRTYSLSVNEGVFEDGFWGLARSI